MPVCANNGHLLRHFILNGYSHHQVEVKEHLELLTLTIGHVVRRQRPYNVLNMAR